MYGGNATILLVVSSSVSKQTFTMSQIKCPLSHCSMAIGTWTSSMEYGLDKMADIDNRVEY
jgi:hypothetical protein